MDYMEELDKIRSTYFIGLLTYEEAKVQCQPILDKMNERAKEIAKKHGKKPLVIKFAGLFR